MENSEKNVASELRQHPVSGDWVLIAPARAKRPHKFKSNVGKAVPKSECPFENPQETNHTSPLLWYTDGGGLGAGSIAKSWSLQVIPNKFPIVAGHEGACPVPPADGLNKHMAAVGFHEIIIPRAHNKFLADMKPDEAELIVRAYQDRILAHKDDDCLHYVLVFHNHGAAAGASVWHPHSQILALPFVPHDVRRSIEGSRAWFEKHSTCVHCEIIADDEHDGTRLVYHNKYFVVLTPYAPHASFEVTILPRAHTAHFWEIGATERLALADALVAALRRLKRVLKNPAYNFFIHTAPVDRADYRYYHWHLEIFPRVETLAGFEHGSGIRVVKIPPEIAAEHLRNV